MNIECYMPYMANVDKALKNKTLSDYFIDKYVYWLGDDDKQIKANLIAVCNIMSDLCNTTIEAPMMPTQICYLADWFEGLTCDDLFQATSNDDEHEMVIEYVSKLKDIIGVRFDDTLDELFEEIAKIFYELAWDE